MVLTLFFNGHCNASGPLIDPLDGQPLGWRLVDADGPAQVKAHWVDAQGGRDRRPCEAMTLVVGNVTRLLLEYRLEPSLDLDDVRATIAVQSVRDGPQVMLRIRYPHIIDPETRQPVITYVRGQRHQGRNAWEELTVQGSMEERTEREIWLRGRYGSAVDLRDAYVDAVIVDAYSGMGPSTIRLDNLRVDGLIDVELPSNDRSPWKSEPPLVQGRTAIVGAVPTPPLFPPGRLMRIVEHNGEQLAHLKMLGFDGLLLTKPPTAQVLREAVQQNLVIYCPPPTAIVPEWEPFLSAVGGWYLGTSVDDTQLDYVSRDAARLRSFPASWQRATMIAPAESWGRYGTLTDGLVFDLPLSVRGLEGNEEGFLLLDQKARTGVPTAVGAAIMTEPPLRLVRQLNALSQSLGADQIEDYGWRWMYLQTARALALCPQAIIFRSSRSLATGDAYDQVRGEVAALINHWLGIVGPLVHAADNLQVLPCSRDDYLCLRLVTGREALIVAIHSSSPHNEVETLANDPDLVIQLPISAQRFLWRITNTTVQQVQLVGSPTEQAFSVAAPDHVEWFVSSDSPAVGGQLHRRLGSEAGMIVMRRWSLASQTLTQLRDDWRAAVAGGILPRTAYPGDALRIAAEQLSTVRDTLARGDTGAAMRATAIGDRLTEKSERLLRNRLTPSSTAPSGILPLLAPGGRVLQFAWLPNLEAGRWNSNLLAAGDLDSSDQMITSGWSYQSRLGEIAEGNVGIDTASGESGSGALRIESSGKGRTPLPGGYAGTVVRVNSSPITFSPGSWIRIEARMKTLGFGGPNQGLLLYETDAGSELGTLVRGMPEWTTVRMYRLVTSDQPLRVVLEAIGGGEALIDWINVSMWQPPTPEPQFRPITAADGPLIR